MGFDRIARELNRQGVPTRSGKPWHGEPDPHRKKKAKTHPSLRSRMHVRACLMAFRAAPLTTGAFTPQVVALVVTKAAELSGHSLRSGRPPRPRATAPAVIKQTGHCSVQMVRRYIQRCQALPRQRGCQARSVKSAPAFQGLKGLAFSE
jgi:hypothetical protein